MNSMNERHAALTTIMLHFLSRGGAATAIVDFHDDPETICDGTLREAIMTLADENNTDFLDITKTLELVEEIAPDLGIEIALRAELCALHCTDPEICGDMHLINADTYARAARNLNSII